MFSTALQLKKDVPLKIKGRVVEPEEVVKADALQNKLLDRMSSAC